ncbi:MAG: hypothetical protein K0R27_3155 [Xanthobacteraceae bacterium]|nr:hypothetical protein [Xanthobacteraceae bacterium]
MATLGELARLIRSKNAGPYMLTFDVMFDDEASYRRVIDARVLTREVFARLYHVDKGEVIFFHHDAAKAIKISIPRPYVQCDLDDGDAYGGQQHAPLVELQVPG